MQKGTGVPDFTKMPGQEPPKLEAKIEEVEGQVITLTKTGGKGRKANHAHAITIGFLPDAKDTPEEAMNSLSELIRGSFTSKPLTGRIEATPIEDAFQNKILALSKGKIPNGARLKSITWKRPKENPFKDTEDTGVLLRENDALRHSSRFLADLVKEIRDESDLKLNSMQIDQVWDDILDHFVDFLNNHVAFITVWYLPMTKEALWPPENIGLSMINEALDMFYGADETLSDEMKALKLKAMGYLNGSDFTFVAGVPEETKSEFLKIVDAKKTSGEWTMELQPAQITLWMIATLMGVAGHFYQPKPKKEEKALVPVAAG